MRIALAAVFFCGLTGTAFADCLLVSGPCSTDQFGNTYTTQQNLGGGYNTYRNGTLNSQTSQDLNGGGWTETYSNGATKNHNYDPYNNDAYSNPYLVPGKTDPNGLW